MRGASCDFLLIINHESTILSPSEIHVSFKFEILKNSHLEKFCAHLFQSFNYDFNETPFTSTNDTAKCIFLIKCQSRLGYFSKSPKNFLKSESCRNNKEDIG